MRRVIIIITRTEPGGKRNTLNLRIIPQNPVRHNVLLALRVPPIGTEPRPRLRRGRRHAEECRESNEQSNKTPVNPDVSSLRRAEQQSYSLDEEQPSVGRSLAYCVVTC